MFKRKLPIDNNVKVNKYSIYINRMILWIPLVYVGTIILQFLEEAIYIQATIFTVLMVLHTILYKFTYQFKGKFSSYYFFLQCAIIFISAFIMPHGSPIVLIGLLPILIAESIHFLENSFKVFVAVVLLYIPYTIIVSMNYGINELPFYLPILFFVIAVSVFYSLLYIKKENAWTNMQYYIKKLEAANQKIEELTIINERKRLARDLHDTLAQGLVGLIMKLEAIDIHLQQGNKDRSRQIVKETMHQARVALKEAREVIDDLRTISNISFLNNIEQEIKELIKNTSIQVKTTIKVIPVLSENLNENVMYMINECLMNITKHAQATKVDVIIYMENKELIILIKDNGIGFNTNIIEKHKGHYGLISMSERARLLNGTVHITSKANVGTSVKVKIPLSSEGEKVEKEYPYC